MVQHNDWFSVDKDKRAARVRSYPLEQILKEVLANSLDAGAKSIDLVLGLAEGTRADRQGRKAFAFTATDDGSGCSDPEILRKVGSSTSDASPEKRGRFGQGLIDVLSVCEQAEILTMNHRLQFDGDGCQVSRRREEFKGMSFTGVLRHGGDGFEKLERYFSSVILLEGLHVTFNGKKVGIRQPVRTIPGIKVATVLYDLEKEKLYSRIRETVVQIYEQYGDKPMIYELGIPVDLASWQLRYDIDVLQKTPLDMERCMLPEKYKESLVRQLMGPMSGDYIEFMRERGETPREIRDSAVNAEALTPEAQEMMVKTHTGHDPEDIVLEDPFDPDNGSETHELEVKLKKKGLNRRHLPEGVKKLLEGHQTVKDVHDKEIKHHLVGGAHSDFPPETDRQTLCLSTFAEIASALLGYPVAFTRFSGHVRGPCGLHSEGLIRLNIKHDFLWDDPMGAQSLAILLHECAHEKVSGHSMEFQNELERLAGKLVVWVGDNGKRWEELKELVKT